MIDILLQKSPRQTEWELIEFIIKLRNENKSYYAIQNYITAVVSFLKIDNVNNDQMDLFHLWAICTKTLVCDRVET
jgi:hypothetical protein